MKRIMLLLLCLLLLNGSALAEEYEAYDDYDAVWEDGYSDNGALIAQEGMGFSCGDNLSWSLDGSTLLITGSGEMYDFYSGAPWSGYISSINHVVFSDGITYVGAFAFQNFDGITTVEFGNSLVSIGKDAFSGCDGLRSISLPSTFKKFGENSFRSCSNLTEIHCSGVFPRFDDNCLWDTYATIYYPASNPWAVSLIQKLEEAFHNRIEFRSSDGTDPYVPTQATEATLPPATEAAEIPWNTEALPQATQPAATQPTIPFYTEPTVPVYTQPTTVETLPVQTLPPATQATISLGDLEKPQPEPYRPAATDGSSVFGLLIVLIMLCILFTGALLFRSSGKRKRNKRSKYRR